MSAVKPVKMADGPYSVWKPRIDSLTFVPGGGLVVLHPAESGLTRSGHCRKATICRSTLVHLRET